jgi:hypothetical protein
MHPYLSQALAAEHMREAHRQAASAKLARSARSTSTTRVATGAHATSSAMVRWHLRRA